MSDRTQGQILINAPRERILDIIGDVPAYPEWATGTTAAEVTEASDRPLRPKRAKFTLETVLKDVYELAYEWVGDGVSWSLLSAVTNAPNGASGPPSSRRSGPTWPWCSACPG